MMRSKDLAYLVSLFVVFAAFGCGDPLVGGECAKGFRANGTRCVPVDGGDGGGEDGGDGGTGDAGDGGGGRTGCSVGRLECDGKCVRPDVDRNHCGDCTTACDSDEYCVGGTCMDSCPAPRKECPDGCVDITSDPINCGDCDVQCASGVCAMGVCELVAPGHLVVIGHDYRSSNGPMRRVLGNSVFLAQGNPVAMLAYEGSVATAARDGINAAIDETATILGRTWSPTAGDAGFITYLLASADVFVIYPQASGTDAELRNLGATWSQALTEFLDRGGIVVLAEGPASHAGTWQILEGAGVFQANGRTVVNDDDLSVSSPLDAVVVGVPISYKGLKNTMWFDTTEDTTVVSLPDGPVVVHRVAVP
ncbi:MAG: hypothetical protein R3A78_13495 [Polyangiales bacterium]